MAATKKHNVLKTFPIALKRLVSAAPQTYRLKFIISFIQHNISPSISILSFTPMVVTDKQALVMVHRLFATHSSSSQFPF